MKEFTVKPIAVIRTDFHEKFGIPRQSGRVKSLTAKIVFNPEYRNPDALREIEGFSYLWLIFDFSLSHKEQWSPTVRPPRLGGNKQVGVFASRSPFRPNHIGLSSVKLLGVEKTENEGHVLIVSGADLLDQTPILDIKPYIPSCDCHTDALGGYASEFTDYKLKVEIKENVLDDYPPEKVKALIDCLAEDPRPSYHEDGRVYGMKFAGANVKFTVSNGILTVIQAEKLI